MTDQTNVAVMVSADLARIFNLRWVLGRVGNDPCDEWCIDTLMGLPEGLTYRDGAPQFQCGVCEAWTVWEGDLQSFENGHYANVCGGSPRCCP